nr:MAG TPA: hypothetical protein [Caudoviricetes sp.]
MNCSSSHKRHIVIRPNRRQARPPRKTGSQSA